MGAARDPGSGAGSALRERPAEAPSARAAPRSRSAGRRRDPRARSFADPAALRAEAGAAARWRRSAATRAAEAGEPEAPSSRGWLGAARRRLRIWLRPPRVLRPTRAGWYFVLITFAVGFAALNTGNNLLYLVLALMLAFLVLSGVLSESALRGIQVRRRLPRELFADADNPVLLDIHNAQRRVPSFAIVVEDRVFESAREGELDVPAGRTFALRVDPGATETRRYVLNPERRGPLVFAGFRVSTRFPFGLFLKFLTIEAPEQTLVYPAVELLRALTAPGAGAAPGVSQQTRGVFGSEVSGLRDYSEGDSPRRVHWKATIRRGALVVRELEDERDSEVEVQLRTRGTGAASRFEERVTWAASEVVAHLDARLRVGLRTDGERIPPGSGARHRTRLLSFLALVEPEGESGARQDTSSRAPGPGAASRSAA